MTSLLRHIIRIYTKAVFTVYIQHCFGDVGRSLKPPLSLKYVMINDFDLNQTMIPEMHNKFDKKN